MSKKRKKKQANIGLIAGASILGIICLLYFGAAIFFATHFSNNTVINEIDASYMSAKDYEKIVREKADEYVLNVYGRNNIIDTINAKEIDLTPDFDGELQKLLKSQSSILWPMEMTKTTESELDTIASFSEEKLADRVKGFNVLKKENIIEPVNAYMSEECGEDGYYVVPQNDGAVPIEEQIYAEVADAVELLSEDVELSDDCYKKAEIRSDNPELNSKVAELNQYYKSDIYYEFGEDTIYVRDYLDEWLNKDSGGLSLDEEAVREFVNGISRKYDTFGISREFKTNSGEIITVKGGTYGWWMNRPEETKQLIEAIKNGEKGKREPEYYSTAVQYGKNDIGNTYVEADLTKQHLWVYEDGNVVIESDFVSGNISKGHGTHTGTYGITYKERDATLAGQGYSSPVSYWMPFNDNEGMHDASWRKEFGGEIYLREGSHGCLNLPKDKAAEIYEIVKKDEPVIVYGGKTEVPALSEEEQLALLIAAGLINPEESSIEATE